MRIAEELPTCILIVDDKEHVRESLRSLVSLESPYYKVLTAAHGAQALALLEREEIDVVLCDFMLTPEMNGTAVTEAIRRHHPAVRVVVFTGKDLPSGTKLKVLEAGAFSYLSKPINHDELLHGIRTINSIRRTEVLGRCFETLSRIAFRLQETFDEEELAQRVVAGAGELGYHRARLYLFDEKRKTLAGKVALGLPAEGFAGYEVPFAASPIIQEIFSRDRPTVWSEEEIRRHFGEKSVEPWLADMDLRGISWIDGPLVVGNRRIGTLAVDHHDRPGREYTRDDLRIVGVFAGLAAQALHNARLFRQEQARHQSGRLMVLGQMVAGIAHEINNPLNNLLPAARDLESGLARQGALTERSQTYLQIIERNGERIQKIVRQLREFARPREFRRERLSLNTVVHDVLGFLETRFRNRDVHLHLDLDPALPEVLGEPTRLQQVLINLLVNAEEAMEEQDEPKEIRIVTRAALPEHVVLLVSDTGPGVPPARRAALFDPFFTTKGPSKGTGLGLSISQEILTLHEGTIGLAEAPGPRGACFKIEMKQAPAEAG